MKIFILLLVLALFQTENAYSAKGDTNSKNTDAKAAQNKDTTYNPSTLITPNPSPKATETISKEDTASINVQNRIADFTGKLYVATMLLFGVTFLLAIIGILQNRNLRRQIGIAESEVGVVEQQVAVSQRQTDILEDTAIRQLRAYIHCTTSKEIPLQTGIIDFILKNSGQTPAKNVMVRIVSEIREFPLTSDLIIAPIRGDSSRSPLHNDTPMTITATIPPTTPEIDAQMQRREKAIYYHGRVEYEDAFGKPRFTNFRYHCFRIGRVEGIARTVEVIFSHEGNDWS